MAAAATECSICLEALKNPTVTLPCSHKFCSKCLEGWRSKYNATSDNACPNCRSKIPPTKQMVMSYKAYRQMLSQAAMKLSRRPYEVPPVPGDPGYEPHWFSEIPLEIKLEVRKMSPDMQQEALRVCYEKHYQGIKATVEKMEAQFGDDLDNVLEDPGEVKVEELPWEITSAAATNDVGIVLDWLGPPPIAPERINAKNPEKLARTILAEAAYEELVGLMNVVLQFGADVDPVNALGTTPLRQATSMGLDKSTRILLEWGANKELGEGELSPAQYAKEAGNKTLSRLLKSPLGCRRCEIFGLQGRKDLNGKACVTTKYLPDNGRYQVKVEHTDEEVAVRSSNLKRRDRTPTDCGYYTTFMGVNKHGTIMWQINKCLTTAEVEAMENQDG